MGRGTEEGRSPLARVLKAALAEAGVKMSRIAPEIGTTYDILNNMANGRTKLDMALVERLRIHLGKPKGWPIEGVGDLRSVAGTPLGYVKVLGSAAAGEATQSQEPIPEPLLVPANMARDDRAGLMIEGVSMWPHLQPGDIAVFKQSPVPRQKRVHLVRDADGSPRVKQLLIRKGETILHSFNEVVSDEAMQPNTTVVGHLVGLYRITGFREMILHDPDGLTFDDEE